MTLILKVSVLVFALLLCVAHSTESSSYNQKISTNQLSYLLAVSLELKETIESSIHVPVKSVFQVILEMQKTANKTVILQDFNNQT